MSKIKNLDFTSGPLFIAEVGAKYAPMRILKKTISGAKAAGCDYVKFQTYQAATISTPGATFLMEDGRIISQFDFFKNFELSLKDHQALDEYCRKIGMDWTSTPSFFDDVELLEKFNLPFYKIGSDDLTNIPLLRYIARKKRPILLSTGMCTLGEIETAVNTIYQAGNPQLILLHCVVSYPSKPEEANLRVIQTLRHCFGLPVGLSDHTTTELTSLLAVAMGAVIIEKHITLDHSLNLADHEASLDPPAFKRLVESVRSAQKALGSGIKSILPTERKWRKSGRKSIFSQKQILKGRKITEADLIVRRPSTGLHPHLWDQIIGRQAQTDIPENTLITLEMI